MGIQGEVDNLDAVPDIANVMKLTMSAKVNSTCDYVNFLLEGQNDKVLLFAHHHEMLDALRDTLRSAKVDFIQIDGRTSSVERPKLVHRFQNDPQVRAAVLSITACSSGMHLAAASVVVFCEMYWVPGIMEQCEARAHRLGQSRMVDIHYVIVENSIDEKIFSLITYKKEAVDLILDGDIDPEGFKLKPEKTVVPPSRPELDPEEMALGSSHTDVQPNAEGKATKRKGRPPKATNDADNKGADAEGKATKRKAQSAKAADYGENESADDERKPAKRKGRSSKVGNDAEKQGDGVVPKPKRHKGPAKPAEDQLEAELDVVVEALIDEDKNAEEEPQPDGKAVPKQRSKRKEQPKKSPDKAKGSS